MLGLSIYFVMQFLLVTFIIIIVLLSTKTPTQNDTFVRFEAIEDVCRKCREMSNSGEVNYFSVEDLERIVEEQRYKEVEVVSNEGARIRKALLAVPVFLVTGIVGVVLFIIFYKDDKFVIKRGDVEFQRLRLSTLDYVIYKFKTLADKGEVNYFSMADIERIADELRHEL